MAAGLVLAQLRAQMTLPTYAAHPTLALVYITDHYAASAQDILDHLGAELPTVTDWSGTVGIGIASSNVEYFDEPALAVMLCALPSDQYRVFSGVAPLPATFRPYTALVHADGSTPELGELVAEMADRTVTGYLFGGLAASRGDVVQFAVGGNGNLRGHGKAGGVFRGGLSGVAFGEGVQIVSRVTQGCQPVAPERRITAADGNLVTELDGEPALDVLLEDLQLTLEQPQAAVAALRQTLVGLTEPSDDVASTPVSRSGHFGEDVIVRHIIGLDPRRRGVAIAQNVEEGMKLAFCRRNVEAARADLVRICAEIREEVEPEELPLAAATALAAADALAAPTPERAIAGAVYVSCSGRGGPHFGGPSAELQIVRRALGDVPLVGFFANGEIARSHLYGYTGVLTVFR
nr:FIST N-terminal domain-containing protein [Ramlibacter ginsenosidimutans]